MGVRSRLTDDEKAKIDVLHSQNYSRQKIADIIGRCKSAVNGYLSRKKDKNKPKTIRRPKITSERAQRALTSIARKGRMTARKVMSRILEQVSLRTVQRVLSEHKHIALGT